MTPETLQTFIAVNLAFSLVKMFLLILLFLYTIFAIIIVRQVHVMNKVVTIANFSPILSIVTFIHLVASLGLFFFTLILL